MSLLTLSKPAVDLAEALLSIPKPEYDGAWDLCDYRCEVRTGWRGDGSFVIEWVAMYDAPAVSDTFEAMQRLSELFGTTKINIGSGRRNGGCETCDYGSQYGTELTLMKPTKNVEALTALAEMRDYFDAGQVKEAREEQARTAEPKP